MKIRRNLAIFSVVILLFSIISPGIAAQGVAACDGILADNRGSTPHVVDEEDFNKFSGSFGSELGDANFNPGADLNNDDKVDYGDFDILNGLSGQSCNLAPVITSSAPTTAAENSPYTYTITVSDPENDGLAYSLPTKPSGMTMSQRQISWTPSFTQADTHNVQISISDTPPGGIAPQTATQSFAITVSNTNRAPTINSIPDRQMNEGEAFSYNVIAADPDGDVLSYSLTQNPSGMSIGSDGVISWTPSFAQSESHSVAVQVSDSAATATRSFTINVADVNVPPTLSISSQSVNENQLLQFTVTPVDPDGDGIASLTASGLPSGATFAGNTFTWTPSFGQAGSYPVEFTATDSKGASSTQSVAIEVSIGNHLPDSWISIPRANNFITTETHPVPFVRREVGYLDYFAGHGSDSDGAVVRYEWDLDGAATNFNEADSVLRLDTPGDFDVSFRVKDNSNAYSDPYEPATPSAFRLVVDRKAQMDFDTFVGSNTPANLANNRIDVSIGSIIWFRIFAGNDPDGELMGDFVKEFRVEFQDGSLFYSPYFSNPGNVVVTDDSTGRYSYKILNEDESFFSEVKLVFNSIGEKTVRLIPTDTFGLEGEPVELTINVVPSPPPEIAPSSLPQNNPPAANPQSASVNEDNSVAITLTGSDPENNILTFSITSNPSSGALSGFNAATGAVTYTPNANFNGADSFAFRVNDGTVDSNTAATVSITVNPVNDAPVITSSPITAASEGSAYSYDVDASDVDSASLAFSITTGPSGMSINTANGLISWTPSFTQAGSYNIIVQVTDGAATATQSFTIVVANVNAPPTLSIGSKSVSENQLLQFTVIPVDPDGDAIASLTAAGLPLGAAFAAGTFSWTPSLTQAGTYTIRFTATDSLGNSAFEDVVVNVNNVNMIPTADAQSATTDEDTAKSITLTGSDLDSEPLTFIIVSNPSSGALSGFNAATGAVTYTPNANFNGADSFAFKVNDGTVDSNTAATVSMTINSVNDAPTANSQSVTTTEDTAKAITLAGSDVEGSALAFSIAANPTKGVLSGFNSATGAVTYMPNADASGADSFAFKVNDGTVDSNTATVSISINSINDAPVLNAIGPQSITEGQLLTFAVTGSDADLDTLTFSAAGLPSGASFAGNTFTWAPGFVQAGSYPVTFTVSDGTATASETVIVTIIEAGNQAPVLGAIGDRAVTEGQALAITLSATDPDGTGALTFTSSPLPSGATLIGNAFSWTPSFTQAGSQSITFIVSDGSLQDSETVTITVNEAGNQAPVLDPISPQSVTEAQTLTFTITATDPDGIVISNFAAISLPAGATFAGNRFTWTPSFVQAGAYTATFTASDGSLTSQPITITITVNEAGNQAPAVTAADQVVDEGQTLVFSVSASDVDSGSLSAITASNLPQGATYSNNQFRWTPLPTQGGVYQVTFSVNDGQLTATRTVQITVRDILLDDGEKKDTPAAKFIDIGNVQIPGGQDFLVPGDLQMLRIDLKNTANIPLKDLKIEVSSPELDINLIKGPYTINPGQKLVRYLDFEVPQDAEPGEHYIRITVSHDKFHRTKYAVVNVI